MPRLRVGPPAAYVTTALGAVWHVGHWSLGDLSIAKNKKNQKQTIVKSSNHILIWFVCSKTIVKHIITKSYDHFFFPPKVNCPLNMLKWAAVARRLHWARSLRCRGTPFGGRGGACWHGPSTGPLDQVAWIWRSAGQRKKYEQYWKMYISPASVILLSCKML